MKNRNYIRIPTAQNVSLYLEPAGVGDRILANILDSLLIFGLIIALIFFASFLNRFGLYDEVYVETLLSLIFFVPYLFYHLVSEIFLNGQSIGKRQMKIQIVRLDGTAPRLSNYFLRWLIRPVDIFFFGIVAIVTITINNQGQRLGDIAAGTTVIKLRPPLDLDKMLSYEFIDDKHYKPVHTEAQMLPEQEIELIKSLIRQKPSPQNTQELEKLAKAYRQELGISSKVPPYLFLKTLVKDFIYLSA